MSDDDGERRGAPATGAMPLAEAAARLGLSRDALRMRLRRGKARGFKQDGQLFVFLDVGAGAVGGSASLGAGPRVRRGADKSAGTKPALGDQAWPALIEQQRAEVARLVRETERLNARLDQHREEVREMRQMLQREQILRQQELALRRDIQDLLQRVLAQPGLPPISSGGKIHAPSQTATEEAKSELPKDKKDSPKAETAETEGDRELAEMLKEIGESLRALDKPDGANES
jgi:hypothetical protein